MNQTSNNKITIVHATIEEIKNLLIEGKILRAFSSTEHLKANTFIELDNDNNLKITSTTNNVSTDIKELKDNQLWITEDNLASLQSTIWENGLPEDIKDFIYYPEVFRSFNTATTYMSSFGGYYMDSTSGSPVIKECNPEKITLADISKNWMLYSRISKKERT